MAQRLGQALDVGYRPLNPADDVAGLAGQRQALGEFEAASADAARQAAAQQAQQDHALRSHETFARLAQQAQKIELDRQQIFHDMEMQREELMMEQRLMPLQVEGMALKNEALRIDNKYAEEEELSALNTQRIRNDLDLANLSTFRTEERELASLGGHEQGLQQWALDGEDVDDYPRPNVTTPKGIAAWKAIVDSVRATNAATRTDAHQDGITSKLSKLTASQAAFMDSVDNTGKSRFKDNQSNYTDEGEQVLNRFARMNTIGISEADRREFIESTKVIHPVSGPSRFGMMTGIQAQPDKGWAEMIDGMMVPTEEGLRELQGRKTELEDKYSPVTKVVTDKPDGGRETRTTFEPTSKRYEDSLDALYKQWGSGHVGEEMSPEIQQKLVHQARVQAAFDVTGKTRAQRQAAMQRGEDVKFWENGKWAFIAQGDPITAGGDVYDAPVSAASYANDLNSKALDDKNAEGATTIRNTPATATLTENVTYDDKLTGFPPEKWNKSVYPRIKTFRDQMVAPVTKQNPNDSFGITKGYGMSEEHADILIAAMKQNAKIKALDDTGGSDIRKQINGAIDAYSDEYVDGHRKALAEQLRFNEWVDVKSVGFTGREYEEIISTEIIDAKVTKGGKSITMKELMAKPATEWEGYTIKMPMAKELWGEGPTPNAPAEGNIHDPNRERFTYPLLLTSKNYDDLGAIRLTFENLIRESAKLKELGQYIR